MIHSIQVIDDELGVLAERPTIMAACAFCVRYLRMLEGQGWQAKRIGKHWRLTKPGQTVRTIGLSLVFTEAN